MTIENTIRDLDFGPKARLLKKAFLGALLIGLGLVYFLIQFKGLGSESAMDYAQIARSLMAGEGFTTRYIRPLAIRQLGDTGGAIPTGSFPDFYNAPLYPLLEAAVLLPVKERLVMLPTDILSMGDRAIALLGIALLLLGVLVWYRVGCLLFDRSLALAGAGLLLVTDLMWQYALSGLPQHLLIVLFGSVTLCALRARHASEGMLGLHSLLWLVGAGVGLGLMSLTSGITAFMLPGLLLYGLLGFRPRVAAFLVILAGYLICVSPWMIRNMAGCGNPLGLSLHLFLAGSGISEDSLMRGVNTGLALGEGHWSKIRLGILDQASHLWEYLGLNLAALGFFVSFLYRFRNPAASLWRLIILLMWGGVVLGMVLFGCKGVVSPNQLHVIFLPAFVLFGTAFLIVRWHRFQFRHRLVRKALLPLLFLLVGTPMLLILCARQGASIQWPPYVPPYVAVLGKYFQTGEILCSDMPWAVAWYANRKCLLLPESLRAFRDISDYGVLGSPVAGLYLTPISGRQECYDLIKGRYKDWGPIIMRTVKLENFPLKFMVSLPINNECTLYADRERW